jgi:hypothetical protein
MLRAESDPIEVILPGDGVFFAGVEKHTGTAAPSSAS